MSPQKFSLSDIPLEQNLNDFGTEGYVKGLELFITHAATPITIALQGEWGSGKTSLMNRLYNDLCGTKDEFIGININTWEFSMLASPEETVIKIISQLVTLLTPDTNEGKKKLAQFLKGVGNLAVRVGKEMVSNVIPGSGAAVDSACIALAAESESITISDLKNALSLAIESSLKKLHKRGIIIFVDDLDRLNPPLAVQILELLKNIFTLNHCIFILAIDYDVVVKGLEPKFGAFSETNEREFRSFFDKIIQVPFSLPVNQYKPMNFVLDSLESIGFISKVEKEEMPFIKENIELIVMSSVGKNPRSIKRLINTLSLLDCIGKCASKEGPEPTPSIKIITLAIVALQVSYPKVYSLLSQNPDFNKWDEELALKLSLQIKEDKKISGLDIIEALCEKDIFLKKHHNDIIRLIEIININAEVANREKPIDVIKNILDRSSFTSVSNPEETEEFDARTFILKLHNNVAKYLKGKTSGKAEFEPKKNTGNGGYRIFLPKGIQRGGKDYFDIIFKPVSLERNNQGRTEKMIALQVSLDVGNLRPESMMGLSYEDVIENPEVKNIIEPLASTVKKLSQYKIIEGKVLFNGKSYTDLIDEYLTRKDELWNLISGKTEYWIYLKSARSFEDPSIISAIGDLILSSYEMNVRAASLK